MYSRQILGLGFASTLVAIGVYEQQRLGSDDSVVEKTNAQQDKLWPCQCLREDCFRGPLTRKYHQVVFKEGLAYHIKPNRIDVKIIDRQVTKTIIPEQEAPLKSIGSSDDPRTGEELFETYPYGTIAILKTGQVLASPHFVIHCWLTHKEDVLFAGEFATDNTGQITYLSRKSGHYRPDETAMACALKILHSKGVDLAKITVNTYENYR